MNKWDLVQRGTLECFSLKRLFSVYREEHNQKHLNHFTRRLILNGEKKRMIEYHLHLQAILLDGLLCVQSACEIRPVTVFQSVVCKLRALCQVVQ